MTTVASVNAMYRMQLDLLEPEDEVDQMLGAAGLKSASQEGHHSAAALRSNKQQLLLVPSVVEGVMLREERIPPSCVLPELPDACIMTQHTSSTEMSQRASCGHNPDQDIDFRRAITPLPSDSYSASMNDASCSLADAPPCDRPSSQPPTTCSESEHAGELKSSSGADGYRKPVAGQENASCATDELANCSHSADCTQYYQVGLAQPIATDSHHEQGESAVNPCVPAVRSSVEGLQKQRALGVENSGSESTGVKRQLDVATDSQCAANHRCRLE